MCSFCEICLFLSSCNGKGNIQSEVSYEIFGTNLVKSSIITTSRI